MKSVWGTDCCMSGSNPFGASSGAGAFQTRSKQMPQCHESCRVDRVDGRKCSIHFALEVALACSVRSGHLRIRSA